MSNKRLYTINNSAFGIDFDKVLSFYIDGEVNTYCHKYERYLNILVGDKFGEPSKIIFIYAHYGSSETWTGYNKDHIHIQVDKLYKDLIEYFNNE